MGPLRGSARVAQPIPEDEAHYPEEFAYDPASATLRVGEGRISVVQPEVYAYSVSGFKVVESWLRYRMKERGGRARRTGTRSVLDEIRPRQWVFSGELLELLWVVEGCVRLWPELETFLKSVITGAQILGRDLPVPSEKEREEPAVAEKSNQSSLTLG